jgi:ketosteroid isomerase-like protein
VQREFGALEFEVHDVVVAGWPWKTRVCTVFTDRSTLRDGTEYVNHGVLYDEGAWGKVKRHRVFFDTQVAADAIGRVVGTAAG